MNTHYPNATTLESSSSLNEHLFFAAFEASLEDWDSIDGKDAIKPIYVGDIEYPNKVVRIHQDGRRELMGLDKEFKLVVERAI